MSTAVRGAGAGLEPRLSLMMFLQYAIWGAWLPLFWGHVTTVLGFTPHRAGVLIAVAASGAVAAPFLFGEIADRRFATEKLLAVLHLAGAVLMWFLGDLETFEPLVGFGLLYSLVYFPTMALTNSLAFHHLPDRDQDFPRVRLWGTIGWIAAGIAMGQWIFRRYVERGAPVPEVGYADAFKLAAILGAAMGLYCLTLPHTPPAARKPTLAFAEAMRYVRRQPLLTLFLVSFPVACIHQFYFVHTAGFLSNARVTTSWIDEVFGVGGGPMTIGQIAEIGVLAAIPAVARSVARKALLLVGLAAYAVRFAVFAWAPLPEAVFAALALHGLCFGCVFFVSFMIIDEETPADVRATAQSLFNLVILGFGIIVGNLASGWAADVARRPDGTTDYAKLFAIPAWVAVAAFLATLVFYPRRAAAPLAGRAVA